jgi:hypothetical protein
MMNEHEPVNGINTGRGNRSAWRKHAVVPLHPPQFTYNLIWDLTQAAEVEIRQLLQSYSNSVLRKTGAVPPLEDRGLWWTLELKLYAYIAQNFSRPLVMILVI